MRGNTWSDLPLIFQCSFHRHVFIESVWNAVSSGQQCICSPWLFLATFNVFSVIPPHFEKRAFLRKQLCWWVGKLWPSGATGDEILTLAEGKGGIPSDSEGFRMSRGVLLAALLSCKLFGDEICVHVLPRTMRSWICLPPGTAEKQMLSCPVSSESN